MTEEESEETVTEPDETGTLAELEETEEITGEQEEMEEETANILAEPKDTEWESEFLALDEETKI